MQLPAVHPAFRLRGIAILTLVVVLSIALPVGIISYSLLFATSGKLLGLPSSERTFYRGVLKDREFWYYSYRYVGKRDGNPWNFRIYRMNIETGTVTVVEDSKDFKRPLWVGNELYGIHKSVYRFVDGAFAKIADIPAGSFNHPWFWTEVFEYDGRLTMVVERNNGKFLLSQLVDDQWIEGREIFLPPPGSVWLEDPEGGFQLSVPASLQPLKSAGENLQLRLKQHEHNVHLLFHSRDSDLVAYRNGFEFVDHDQGIASALSPENTVPAPHQQVSSGWEPIQSANSDARWHLINVDRAGVLICESDRRGLVVRRSKSGDWVNLDGQVDLGTTRCVRRTILVDQSDGAGYILDTNEWWNSIAVSRINGNTVQAPSVLKQGLFDNYLARWSGLIAGIFLAWLVHASLLAGAADRTLRGASTSDVSSGPPQRKLTSMTRRGMAFFADVLFLAAIFVLLTSAQCPLFGITFPSLTFDVCQFLSTVESVVDDGIRNGFHSVVRDFISQYSRSQPIHFPTHGYRELLTAEVVEILLVLVIGNYVEGRAGITPGKWLFGIRTVSTSLRPCGFARALVRNMLLWADFLFFVTPIPAAISMMFSPNRQRLGDRVAETIVVNANSIRQTDEAVCPLPSSGIRGDLSEDLIRQA